MKIIFQLSGEHPNLPGAEILAVLDGEGIDYKIPIDDNKNRILMKNRNLILDIDAGIENIENSKTLKKRR